MSKENLCRSTTNGRLVRFADVNTRAPRVAKLLNRMFRKLGDQADRQKTIPLVTATGASQGIR